MSVRDLLSLAYKHFQPGYSAPILFEAIARVGLNRGSGHRDLFATPRGWSQLPASNQRSPLFETHDLGDPAAIARWVRLTSGYPDAANAIRVGDRTPTNPTRRLLELGAAIEHYVVVVNAREAKLRGRRDTWARTTKERLHATAMAEHAGSSFGESVGDPALWGRAF